jgi:hypothetical protein
MGCTSWVTGKVHQVQVAVLGYTTSNQKAKGVTMTIEQEIRQCFQHMGQELSSKYPLLSNGVWFSLSQYGYAMTEHRSKAEAEAATIRYYSERMNLIRQ